MAEETKADVDLANKSQRDDTDKSEDELNSAKIEKDVRAKPAKKKNSKASTEEDEESESSDDEEHLGIYDKPVVIEGKRQRKSTEFLHTTQQSEKKEPKMLQFDGLGEKLGNMERVVHQLSHSTPLELKPLHKLLFGREGKQHEIKKNIKSFNGFSFGKGSKDYDDKVSRVERFTNQGLQRLCEIFDLEKKGKRDDIMSRVMEFLMLPKPSGKPLIVPKKKSKPKAKKKKAKQSREETKGKKRKAEPKSKEEVEDGSDEGEDEKEKTSEEDEPPKKKKKVEKPRPKASPEKSSPKKKVAKAKEAKESPKKKTTKDKEKDKKVSKKPAKKGGPVAVKITPLKKASPKKTPKKGKPKPVDDESSSDEEPLAKMTKKPPSNAELEKVVREILDGADLEQVTMKSVCKQVFEKYPDFDLIPRKDFIKETVRKVIS